MRTVLLGSREYSVGGRLTRAPDAPLFDDRVQGRHHLGAEERAVVAAKLAQRPLAQPRLLVGPSLRNGVEGVGHRDHPTLERDLVARQPARVPQLMTSPAASDQETRTS